jgi:hypothetical protein
MRKEDYGKWRVPAGYMPSGRCATPILDFNHCGAQFEHFFHVTSAGSINDYPCECGATAVRYYEYRRPHSYSGLTEAAVVYKSLEDGHYYIPAATDAPMPQGFERVELRSAQEIRRVEKEMTKAEYQKWQNSVERQQLMYEESRRDLRAELTERMKGMSNLGRDFARLAISKGNAMERPRFKGEVHFEAFSMNSSNRGSHSDERTGWKSVKR